MNVLLIIKEPCPTSLKIFEGIKYLSNNKIKIKVLCERKSASSVWNKLGFIIDLNNFIYKNNVSLFSKLIKNLFHFSLKWEKTLKEIAKDKIDIIQTLTPDYIPILANKHFNKPIFHHMREIETIFPGYFISNGIYKKIYPIRKFFLNLTESKAVKVVNVLSFDSFYSLKLIKNKYNLNKKMIVLKNAPLSTWLPKNYKAKLSQIIGKPTIVFHGHLNEYFLPFFYEICKNNIDLHIYPIIKSKKAEAQIEELKKFPNFHIHNNIVGYSKLIYELSQYDFGIIPPSKECEKLEFFNVYLPCKIFDYLAAGLTVLSGNYRQIKEYILSNKIGYIINNIDDLFKILEKKHNLPINPKYADDDLLELINLYNEFL